MKHFNGASLQMPNFHHVSLAELYGVARELAHTELGALQIPETFDASAQDLGIFPGQTSTSSRRFITFYIVLSSVYHRFLMFSCLISG